MKFFAARGFDQDRVALRAFAMAASVLGVPLQPVPFVDRRSATSEGPRRELAWLLDAESPDGRLETENLWRQWNDAGWRERHPDSPISILRRYHDALLEAERREPDYAELAFSRGNRTLTVPAAWPKEKILEAIKKL